MTQVLNNNSLAFIALANEYCQALEQASGADGRDPFADTMLRLLPRLYIAATDINPEAAAGAEVPVLLDPAEEDIYIQPSLEEEYYDAVRRGVEALMGPDDVYLEVFEEDMKYSDTPVAASISEGLADIFQALYNFTEMVRDAPARLLPGIMAAEAEEFRTSWSRPLCNVLRALNALRYQAC